MNLYLVRHARPQVGGDDPALSLEGQQQAAKLAALFARVAPPRDRLTILASTLRRARDTAEAIAAALGVADLANFPGPDDDPADLPGQLLQRLRDLAAAGRTELLVVGHSDYLPAAAAHLLGTAAAPFPGGTAHAAAAGYTADPAFGPASARLRWLALPELLDEPHAH